MALLERTPAGSWVIPFSEKDHCHVGAEMTQNSGPLIAAGTLMGIGLGGLFDGILFHQLLQLHSMLSNWSPRTTLANEEINMFWDGLFHAFCFVAIVAAVNMLWRCLRRPGILVSGQCYLGSLCVGWGVFNLVEGLIDHEILQVHHVYQGDPHRYLLWDLAFLASGALFIFIGWWTIQADPKRRNEDRPLSIDKRPTR
jgi:uncharacterized membrane protein